MDRGLDYSWGRPHIPTVVAEGYRFVCRYISYDTTGKNITASELAALRGAGLEVALNWQWAGSWPELSVGASRGSEHAREAVRQARDLGYPAGCTIYFSVDFDATPAQLSTVLDYFRGVAEVRSAGYRVGAYGGLRVIGYLFDRGAIDDGWQTYAWSGGQWDARATLRQVHNGVRVAGAEVDINERHGSTYFMGGGGNVAPTERVLPHEIHYQDTGYFCGPAATRTALSVRGVVVAESTLAGILKTTTAGTNSSNDIVRGLNAYLPGIYSAKFIPGSSASAAQAEQFRRDLVHSVAAGYAVVANVVGTARASDGRNYSYPGGHYVSVVGYRKDGAEAYVSDNAVGRDYWMTTAVLATWIAGRGYAWAAGARAASSPKGRGRRVGAVVQHGHVYYFAPGYVKHLANPAEAMEMVNAETKEIHQTDAAGLQRVIWGYGLEEFSVADVEKLAKKPGGFLTASWLRGDGKTDVSALASKVDALAKQISDVAKSVADLAKRPAGEVDVAAIARAVNDDAARRLAE